MRIKLSTMAPSTTAPDQVKNAIADLLLVVMRRMHEHFEERISEFDLNPALAFSLRALDEPVPQRGLADVLHCDPSHITGIVDRLEKRGLVERAVDPDDRRIKNISVTDAGRQLRTEMEARLYEKVPGLDNLSKEEQRQLNSLLTKMTESN